MSRIYGSSGKTSNPLAVIGLLTGVIGAAFSVALWIHFYNPDATFLGSYSEQIITNVQFANQLRLLAAAFGAMAVIAGIAGGLGGTGGAATIASIILGIVGLSYPVLSALNLVEGFVPNTLG